MTERHTLKTARTYNGCTDLLNLVGPRTGYIARQPQIPSPYSYSPEWFVYDYQGHKVVVRETAHKKFEIVAVDPAAVYTDAKF